MFSRCQCGFCKGINKNHILLAMIEKRKISRDKKQFCVAILTDLSKAIDCIRYDLLIAKLNAYGFDQEALKSIIATCLIDQKKLKRVFYLAANWIFCATSFKGQCLVHYYLTI